MSIYRKKTQTVSEGYTGLIHETMLTRLAKHFNIPPSRFLKDVVKSISPFSSKPKALRYDLDTVSAPSDDSFNLAEMMDSFDSLNIEGGMDDLLKDFLSNSSNMDKDTIEELFNGSNGSFESRMRISKPMEPYYYLVAIDHLLQWKTSNKSESFEHGTPVFHWFDENDEENPVFLNSAVIFAGDTGDTEVLGMLQEMVEDSITPFEKPITLFGNIAYRSIKGNDFAIMGIWHDGNHWRWLFLSELTPEQQARVYPESKIDNLENTLMTPPPSVELMSGTNAQGLPTHLVYQCIVSPSVEPTESSKGQGFTIGNRPVISSHSGWNIYI